MTSDPLRLLRLRWEPARDRTRDRNRPRNPGRDAIGPRGTPRFVGRVASGGAFPGTLDRVFLVHPVRLDGDGATTTPLVDGGRSIPVVIVGARLPAVGDLVLVHSVGGRWVAESTGTVPTTVACSRCAIPRRDLTISWVNGQLGGGSALMLYDGLNQWTCACAGPLGFRLACEGGSIAFSAAYFPNGGCPDGSSQACSASSAAPNGLTLVQQICTPFLLSYSATPASCPGLASQGYTQFTITH